MDVIKLDTHKPIRGIIYTRQAFFLDFLDTIDSWTCDLDGWPPPCKARVTLACHRHMVIDGPSPADLNQAIGSKQRKYEDYELRGQYNTYLWKSTATPYSTQQNAPPGMLAWLAPSRSKTSLLRTWLAHHMPKARGTKSLSWWAKFAKSLRVTVNKFTNGSSPLVPS